MGYHKRFEDSYLDDDGDELDGDAASDGEKLLALIGKPERTEKETARIQKLIERMLRSVQMPDPLRSQAIEGLETAAHAYKGIGAPEQALELWALLADVAGIIGDKNLYYRATDEMSNSAPEVYDEYHPDLFG